MIKVCNRAPNPIQIGNITIPGFSSVLLNSFPSTMETNRLKNNGLLSVCYVPNEVGNDAVKEEFKSVDETITTYAKNTSTEEVPTTTRKRGRSKSTVDTTTETPVENTTETNITKGDIEYASDND